MEKPKVTGLTIREYSFAGTYKGYHYYGTIYDGKLDTLTIRDISGKIINPDKIPSNVIDLIAQRLNENPYLKD